MLKIDEENGLLRIRASGQLESSDYDDFVPRFEQLVGRKPGKLPMVIELASDFAGWDLPGLWRDLKFDAHHQDSFGRIAIVGDAKWDISAMESNLTISGGKWLREILVKADFASFFNTFFTIFAVCIEHVSG